jgi:signal transduction histidine kinase
MPAALALIIISLERAGTTDASVLLFFLLGYTALFAVGAVAATLVREFSSGAPHAVRYRRASRVQVRMSQRADRLVLDISGNGNGFDNAPGSSTADELSAKNAGSMLLEARAEKFKSTLYIPFSPNSTNLLLECPL